VWVVPLLAPGERPRVLCAPPTGRVRRAVGHRYRRSV